MEYTLNNQNSKIEYFRGLKAFFKDPNFGNNILIGSVHALIPIVGPIVLMGWGCEIMQRLSRQHPQPIPKLDFSDFSHYLSRGVIPFLVAFVAQIILSIFIYILMFAGIFGFSFMIGQVGENSSSGLVMTIAFFLVMSLIGLAVMVPGLILSNSLQTFAELTEDFSRSFNFSFLKNYMSLTWKKACLAYLLYLPLGFIFGIIGIATCYIGLFPAIVLLMIGMLYVRWQIYAYYLSLGQASLEIKAPVALPSEQKVALPPTPPPAR